jgi:hypothetical protein
MWPWRDPRDTSRYLILTGIPPAPGWIDCLQAVISRKIWLEIGGWYDRSKSSDGAMYSKLIRERAARFVSEVLGERW